MAGETKIRRGARGKSSFEPTVEEMYKIMNDKDYAKSTNHYDLHKKYRLHGFGCALSMYDDGKIRSNKIVAIRYAGVQDIYEVKTESGQSIKCTMNHKFPTPIGKKELSELSVGDELYISCEYEKNNNKYSFTNGNYQTNIPMKGQKGFQKNPNGNSVIFKATRELYISNNNPCECCGKEFDSNERFELHHKDFDRTNNCSENYEWLCVSCHKKKHYQGGRKKRYEKGIPTKLDKIISIEYVRTDSTYDVEMEDPAHTIVSENGLVASNSHSYCVALDSLYGAYLKCYYPLEFYSAFLNILQEKGDKDRMNAAKDEAESYFGITFPPYRFRQDNRSVKFNKETNQITNTIAAIKGYSKSVAQILYECGLEENKTFLDVLFWLKGHGIYESKIRPLIEIDYFSEFGNSTTLNLILDAFEFFKRGESKTLKDDNIDAYRYAVEKYASNKNKKGEELKSWKVTDCVALLYCVQDYLNNLKISDIPYKMKAEKQLDVLGYFDITSGKEEDRRKIMVTNIYPLISKNSTDNSVWGYRVFTRSIGSGKSASLTCRTQIYDNDPISKGDILYAKSCHKNKDYWYLDAYEVIE